MIENGNSYNRLGNPTSFIESLSAGDAQAAQIRMGMMM